MPRYGEHERKQSIMVPIQFDEQIQPGTFEHAIDDVVDNEIDLSEFEEVYRNDETGAMSDSSRDPVEDTALRLLEGNHQQPTNSASVRGE